MPSRWLPHLLLAVIYGLCPAVFGHEQPANLELAMINSMHNLPRAGATRLIGSEGIHGGLEQTGFSSQLEAVIAAVNFFNPLSIHEDREYIGAVVHTASGYFYTADSGDPGKDQISIRIRVPRGTPITAFWHTHGDAGWDREYFSREDSALVNSTRKPFYLADYTGRLKVLLPDDDNTVCCVRYVNGLPNKGRLIRGREVADSNGNLVLVQVDN